MIIWLCRLWENIISALVFYGRSHLPGMIEEMSEQLYAEIEANRPKPIQGIELVPYAELEAA